MPREAPAFGLYLSDDRATLSPPAQPQSAAAEGRPAYGGGSATLGRKAGAPAMPAYAQRSPGYAGGAQRRDILCCRAVCLNSVQAG